MSFEVEDEGEGVRMDGEERGVSRGMTSESIEETTVLYCYILYDGVGI